MRQKSDVMKDLGRVLNKQVSIEKLPSDIGSDTLGNQEIDWLPFEVVFADVNTLYGKEYYAAKAVGEEKTIKFTIRQDAIAQQLNTVDFRINYNEIIYDLKQIDHLPDGIWTVIRAEGR